MVMKIESAELLILRLPIRFRFETSFGTQTERTIPLLILKSQGLEGYAEGVMEKLPGYGGETVTQTQFLLAELLLPQILGREFANPESLAQFLSPSRAGRMTKAMVEMAFYDLWAKSLNLPLWQVLGGSQTDLAVGVSLGIQPSLEATLALVEAHLEQGYRRIKLKIKPGWDVEPVSAVRSRFPGAHLSVDANSAYSLKDRQVFQALDELELSYIEQPLFEDDLLDHASLQAELKTPICLDESLTSPRAVRQALQLDAARVVNIKAGRMGGLSAVRESEAIARSFGVPLWCGGMLEAGVGRATNLHLSTLSGFTLPGDVSSASRYWEHDIIQEPLEAEDGLMHPPAGAGIGVHLDRKRIGEITLAKSEFS